MDRVNGQTESYGMFWELGTELEMIGTLGKQVLATGQLLQSVIGRASFQIPDGSVL